MKTKPTRVAEDLFEAARREGLKHGRTPAQQLDVWIRAGREYERTPGVTVADILRLRAQEPA